MFDFGLMTGEHHGMSVSGKLLLKTIFEKPKKAGSTFLAGTLADKDNTAGFKIFDDKLVNNMRENLAKAAKKVVCFEATIDLYGNDVTLIVSKIKITDEPIREYYNGIDVQKVFEQFQKITTSMLSENGMAVLQELFSLPNVLDRFKSEFAASSMHDDFPGGLLNHTTHMLEIAKTLIEIHPEEFRAYTDILILGIAFHDIGKILEYSDGVKQPNTFSSHLGLGQDILVELKDKIMEKMGIGTYEHLKEIIAGHHNGLGGDKQAATVWAYFVHLVDMLESQTTGILNRIKTEPMDSTTGKFIRVDGKNLYF